jgi:S1-C subfamily serine protease
VAMRLFLRAALGVTGLALAGCSVTLGSPPRSEPSVSSHSGSASIPIATATPGGTEAGSSLDAVRVNEILGPAVGEVITDSGLGSGFVIAHDGTSSYMVTNNHVVQGARRVEVLMPDGKHYAAEIQGTDPLEDVAVVRIPDASLPTAVFGDSTKVKVGQPVVAIGNPEGQEGSVTAGIISAVHRTLTGVGGGPGAPAEDLPDVIQTDAAINPGNSGGPLADESGHVIGINTAGQTNAQGIGYAIPSLVAKRIAEALIAGRKPGHPYLGISYQSLAAALAQGNRVSGYGIVIQCVVPGSPADHAGVRAGDVIESVDGVNLNNGNTLGGVLQLHNPGDAVPLTAVRGGSAVNLTVTLGDRPASTPSCR